MSIIGIIDDTEYANEDYSFNKNDVNDFREMVTCDKSLYCPTDNIFLQSFLRATKFNKTEALQLLKDYFATRRSFKTFHNFIPSSEKVCLDAKFMGYMDKPDQDGRIILIGSAKNWDPSVIHILQYVKCLLMYIDMLLTTHAAQVNGFCMVFDSTGFSSEHLDQYTPSVIHEVVSTIFGSARCRWEEMHIINTNDALRSLLLRIMPVLPSDIKDKLHVHNEDISVVRKYINPKYLPEDFGGELSRFDAEKCNKVLRANEAFFRKNEEFWKNAKN